MNTRAADSKDPPGSLVTGLIRLLAGPLLVAFYGWMTLSNLSSFLEQVVLAGNSDSFVVYLTRQTRINLPVRAARCRHSF